MNGNGNDDKSRVEGNGAVSGTSMETQAELVEAEEESLSEHRQRVGETNASPQDSD